MQEWYLIKRPSLSSRLEDSSFNSYKSDAIYEMLDSEAGSSVELCNHDLSKRKTVRCLINGKAADTYESALDRTVVFPIGTVKTGMYLFFGDHYWLVVSCTSENNFYEKVQIKMCQYLLKWQNDNGDIVKRWIHLFLGGSSVGESRGMIMTLLKYDYSFFIPCDEETLMLDNKRVFIDVRKKDPFKVFELTRSDDAPYCYGDRHGGVLYICANRTELNPQTDNQDLKICDYIDTTPPSEPVEDVVKARIAGNLGLIYGLRQNYVVSFCDENSVPLNPDDIDFKWNIVSNVTNQIHSYVKGTVLELFVDNYSVLGEELLLQVIVDDKIAAELMVTVMDIV